MNALQVTWFILIGVLLTGYAVLDGFDLGVGFWYLFTRKESQRRAMLAMIGPFWDGNEVWLLTGGGAIFAAFPHVYATVFSGFYLAMMMLVISLIFRATALEFRNKVESRWWRRFWDLGFAIGSTLPAVLFGVAMGNILKGVPMDAAGNFTGTFLGLLTPYTVFMGLLSLAMFATHGALFITLRAEDSLAESADGWARKAWMVYAMLYIVIGIMTISTKPHLLANFGAFPLAVLVVLLAHGCVFLIGLLHHRKRNGWAFITSALAMAMSMAMIGVSLFPLMVPSLADPSTGLTIVNASSSRLTLRTMLIMASLGVPLVLAYTAWIYHRFWGKVGAENEGY
ncbi:cytochrome d ubiquinol oxidase subunit II [bacterium]|nr:cytochrome d ubiquinol oxidase subunit II [candidate division CSSED10-310 bacterium]